MEGIHVTGSEHCNREVTVGTIIWSSEERVYGGCLGVLRRGRPWQAAKSGGEEQTSIDPPVAEWGNPTGVSLLSVIE